MPPNREQRERLGRSEKPTQGGDDYTPDSVQKLLQDIGDNLASAALPVPERYAYGHLKIHVHVGVRVADAVMDGFYYCVLFEGDG